MNKIIAFPLIEITYKCSCCNEITKRVYRELWLFGIPIVKINKVAEW